MITVSFGENYTQVKLEDTNTLEVFAEVVVAHLGTEQMSRHVAKNVLKALQNAQPEDYLELQEKVLNTSKEMREEFYLVEVYSVMQELKEEQEVH